MLNLSSSHMDYIWLEGREKKKASHYNICRANYMHSLAKQTISLIFNRIIFCFVCVCPSVCVCSGREARLAAAKVTRQHQRQKLNGCYKAAHCEAFKIWTATSATRRGGKDTRSLGAAPTLTTEGWCENMHDFLLSVSTDFISGATTASSFLTKTSSSARRWMTLFNAGN